MADEPPAIPPLSAELAEFFKLPTPRPADADIRGLLLDRCNWPGRHTPDFWVLVFVLLTLILCVLVFPWVAVAPFLLDSGLAGKTTARPVGLERNTVRGRPDGGYWLTFTFVDGDGRETRAVNYFASLPYFARGRPGNVFHFGESPPLAVSYLPFAPTWAMVKGGGLYRSGYDIAADFCSFCSFCSCWSCWSCWDFGGAIRECSPPF